MEKYILKNIKSIHLKNSLRIVPGFIIIHIFCIGLIWWFWALFHEDCPEVLIPMSILPVFGLISGYVIMYIRLKLVFSPMKSTVFIKFGGIDRISQILEEIKNTKIYDDKYITISDNYILHKDNVETLTRCDDVLGLFCMEINGNEYTLRIFDKFGEIMLYNYGHDEYEEYSESVRVLISKCKNAKVDKDCLIVLRHVRENKVNLKNYKYEEFVEQEKKIEKK